MFGAGEHYGIVPSTVPSAINCPRASMARMIGRCVVDPMAAEPKFSEDRVQYCNPTRIARYDAARR